MTTIFDRLDQGRPASVEEKVKVSPTQRLLDWLQTWNKPTICAREILMYGPRPTRNQKDADAATKVLQKYGWLVPLETNQRNWRQWQIVRKGPVIYPKVAG